MAERDFKTTDDIKAYYTSNIERYGLEAPRTMGYHTGPIDDRLIRPLLPQTLPPSYSVLDVGCGLGQIIPILSDRFPDARLTRFLGIDLVDDFILRCRQNFPQYAFQTADFLNWDSPERFDVVLAAGVLVSRIADYEEYLARIIEGMVNASQLWIGFNVVSACGATYTAKHLATITEESLNDILKRFPQVTWNVKTIEVFPGANDTFVCGMTGHGM